MSFSFGAKVYELTRKIPKGKVATYGQLAKLAGKPRAARAVGALMSFSLDLNPRLPRLNENDTWAFNSSPDSKSRVSLNAPMRTNPDAPNTPCHRVVAKDGSLTGYSGKGGVSGKKSMLIAEGVIFKDNKQSKSLSTASLSRSLDKVDLFVCQWR